MFDTDFWADAEVISTYSDSEAIEDGVLIDVSELKVFFNGKLIQRVTNNCANAINLFRTANFDAEALLGFITRMAKKDGESDDAWGIIEQFHNHKLWLVGNELSGYTLMLPSDY